MIRAVAMGIGVVLLTFPAYFALQSIPPGPISDEAGYALGVDDIVRSHGGPRGAPRSVPWSVWMNESPAIYHQLTANMVWLTELPWPSLYTYRALNVTWFVAASVLLGMYAATLLGAWTGACIALVLVWWPFPLHMSRVWFTNGYTIFWTTAAIIASLYAYSARHWAVRAVAALGLGVTAGMASYGYPSGRLVAVIAGLFVLRRPRWIGVIVGMSLVAATYPWWTTGWTNPYALVSRVHGLNFTRDLGLTGPADTYPSLLYRNALLHWSIVFVTGDGGAPGAGPIRALVPWPLAVLCAWGMLVCARRWKHLESRTLACWTATLPLCGLLSRLYEGTHAHRLAILCPLVLVFVVTGLGGLGELGGFVTKHRQWLAGTVTAATLCWVGWSYQTYFITYRQSSFHSEAAQATERAYQLRGLNGACAGVRTETRFLLRDLQGIPCQ